jgi:hypothetical protein
LNPLCIIFGKTTVYAFSSSSGADRALIHPTIAIPTLSADIHSFLEHAVIMPTGANDIMAVPIMAVPFMF